MQISERKRLVVVGEGQNLPYGIAGHSQINGAAGSLECDSSYAPLSLTSGRSVIPMSMLSEAILIRSEL
jgi:hypothetical protein